MVLAALLAACDGGSAAAPAGGSPDAGSPQLDPGTPERPPMGQKAIEAWLAAGHYQQWACETGISSKRLNGAHGRHRICSNQLLLDDDAGVYPIGAASVKEMFEGPRDEPGGYAVGVKVADGIGPETWYWYERTGRSPTSRPVADKVGEKICGPDCHGAAPRDNVFITAPRP